MCAVYLYSLRSNALADYTLISRIMKFYYYSVHSFVCFVYFVMILILVRVST
jgi:hypothetical protein